MTWCQQRKDACSRLARLSAAVRTRYKFHSARPYASGQTGAALLTYSADQKEVHMNHAIHALLGTTLLAFGAHAAAQVTYYQDDNFKGRNATATARVSNLERAGFRQAASSVVVTGQRWQACDDTR